MMEETMAYLALDEMGRDDISRVKGIMGPGKMAKFVTLVTNNIIEKNGNGIPVIDGTTTNTTGVSLPLLDSTSITNERIERIESISEQLGKNQSGINNMVITDDLLTNGDTVEHEISLPQDINTTTISTTPPEQPSNTTTTILVHEKKYACRICRTILFDTNDLEDPVHVPSAHGFSWRKMRSDGIGYSCQKEDGVVGVGSGDGGKSKCGSVFLRHSLDWMGGDGKIKCYKCSARIGQLRWSGSQCSCGTWVTPAIQIGLAKIDIINVS